MRSRTIAAIAGLIGLAGCASLPTTVATGVSDLASAESAANTAVTDYDDAKLAAPLVEKLDPSTATDIGKLEAVLDPAETKLKADLAAASPAIATLTADTATITGLLTSFEGLVSGSTAASSPEVLVQ